MGQVSSTATKSASGVTHRVKYSQKGGVRYPPPRGIFRYHTSPPVCGDYLDALLRRREGAQNCYSHFVTVQLSVTFHYAIFGLAEGLDRGRHGIYRQDSNSNNNNPTSAPALKVWDAL